MRDNSPHLAIDCLLRSILMTGRSDIEDHGEHLWVQAVVNDEGRTYPLRTKQLLGRKSQ